MAGANQNAGFGGRARLIDSAQKTGEPLGSNTPLNAKNLEAMGYQRFAELLIEVSTGNAAAKRKLRLELAGAQSPSEAVRETHLDSSTARAASLARCAFSHASSHKIYFWPIFLGGYRAWVEPG